MATLNLNSLLKVTLMSTGVFFVAGILLSLSFLHTYIHQLLLSSQTSSDLIPTLWFGIRSWLRPPYLYFIINAIIITILASSRLHHHAHATPAFKDSAHDRHQHDVIVIRADQFSPYGYDPDSLTEVMTNSSSGSYYGVVSVKDIADVEVKDLNQNVPETEIISVGPGESGTSTVVKTALNPVPALLERQKPVEISSEKPPASSRFGHHRRLAKTNPAEGVKALRTVAKSRKKQDTTLESTWRTITEGRHVPLTRHLKKSDTWENESRQINLLDDSFPDPSPVRKFETFKDRTNHNPPRVTKLKKDPSLGQDELNRRVEAFINKFNADMKLQREQSMQQFMDKINRGAY